MEKHRSQSGQVVLITLLVLTIATTVALSLIARTTIDTAITSQVEESSRAFSAAEAGIEEALKTASGTIGAKVLTSGVLYNVTVNSIGGAAGVYQFPKKTVRGTTETLWLVPHTDTGLLDETADNRYKANTLDVCWSKEVETPALLITVLYKQSTGEYEVVKAAYDPNQDRSATNKFTWANSIPGCIGSGTFYKATIRFSSLSASLDPTVDSLIAIRIRPLYSDTKIAIHADAALPLQGKSIESTGSTSTGTNRKIVVIQQYRSAPSIFDAALYSQGDLSQ